MLPKNLHAAVAHEPANLARLTEEVLAENAFIACQPNEALSFGWEPTRDDLYRYEYAGHSLLTFTVEKKTVPASAIQQRTRALVKARQAETGREPGRKVLKELKEEAKADLIRVALPSRKSYQVWLDRHTGRILINTTSNTVVSAILGQLYSLAEIQPHYLPGWPTIDAMTRWVNDEPPEELSLDDAVKMEFPGEQGKTVTYSRANLTDKDVQLNTEHGAQVLGLAVTYDSRISFKLGNACQLSGLKFTDIGGDSAGDKKHPDYFQNSFYLAATTLSGLLNYLSSPELA
jgi:recombination associated protein RdgC